jgi:LPXTG-motif cell wall-anchored protein
MRNNNRRIRLYVKAAAGAVLALLLTATVAAADPTPGSSQGGTPGPSAPAGVKVSTELPSKISVDNTSEATTLTARITNNGSKATPAIVLSVVGFGALKVTDVKGCSPVPTTRRPKGANGAYYCQISALAAGASKAFTVSATYDLQGKGQICLPVTLGTGETLLWQQGPVPFGTTRPTPNAPDTPLLLGTNNVPAGQDVSASPSPDLPSTGAPEGALPLALAGGLLLAAGAAGLWLTTRKPRRH